LLLVVRGEGERELGELHFQFFPSCCAEKLDTLAPGWRGMLSILSQLLLSVLLDPFHRAM
jgi:hypothetical protein